MLTEGSLFSGIGGWTLACEKFGIKSLWASEIEKFPIEVMMEHFPQVKQLGDVRELKGNEIEPVDIITAGSPCQDFSVANSKRQGLQGERSGLFCKAIKIINEMREATKGKQPRFFIFENVPGVLNCNGGMDYQEMLEEITKSKIPMPDSGRWAGAGMVRGKGIECAWRILDAQYWGVAQRRRRLFLIADFRGKLSAKILFKPESLSRDIEKGENSRQEVAAGIATCIRKSDGKIAKKLDKKIYGISAYNSNAMLSKNAKSGIYEAKTTRTIDLNGGNPACNQGGMVILEKSHLASGKKTTGCLMANCGTKQWLGNQEAFSGDYHIIREKNIRRLTPLECERLQGLPEQWTLINTKKCTDSARYKAIGNGMAQPCPDFIINSLIREMKIEKLKENEKNV